MSPYEKMQFRFTKFKIKTGLGLNESDCKLIRDHNLAAQSQSKTPGSTPAATFREDLGSFKVYVRKDSSDMSVLYQVIIKNQYGPVVDLVRTKYRGKIGTIIDAGANIGLATLHFKKNFAEAHVISLEPDQSNYGLLKKNIEANKLTRVTPLQAGLWKSRKNLRVVKDVGDGREWSFAVEESTVQDNDTVAGYGILDLVNENRWATIDILKIDIEGAERVIFEDDKAVREFLSRTRFLAMEIHDQFVSRTAIQEQLRANHFEFFDSGELTIAVNKKLVNQQ